MNGSEVLVADAKIESFAYGGGRVTVLIRTVEGAFEVIFQTVLGVKAISPEGQDLSHLAKSIGTMIPTPGGSSRKTESGCKGAEPHRRGSNCLKYKQLWGVQIDAAGAACAAPGSFTRC